jgi:cardiolipin synthase
MRRFLLLWATLLVSLVIGSPRSFGQEAAVMIQLNELSVQEQHAFRSAHQVDGRRRTKISQLGGHFTKSFVINPIRHPIRTSLNLFRLVRRSSTDMLQTMSLHLLRFPLLRKVKSTSSSEEAMDLVAFERRLDRITGTRQQHGRLRFLIDGDEFFPRFIESITNAEEFIKIRTYIFDNDDYALLVAGLLKDRSNTVPVKVLMDGLGTIQASFVGADSQPSGYVGPASINRVLNDSDGELESRLLSNTWFAGDHTKTAIIDGHTAFLGGMNIGREYRFDWHDMMVELGGPVVQQLDHDFDKAWKSSMSRDPPRASNDGLSNSGLAQMRLLYTSLRDPQIYKSYLAAIKSARQYIYIENAYFSDDRLRYELIKASRRGVDVRVILPGRSNHDSMNKSNTLAANSLFKHGVRVYMYPGMSHVKAAIVDGWACFGSANLDKLSLKINKEANIATSDRRIVNELKERLFKRDFQISKLLTKPLDTRWNYQLHELLADAMF